MREVHEEICDNYSGVDPEAMVPVEVEAGSLRRDNFEQEANKVNQRPHPDMVEEVRRESQTR